MQDDKKRDPDDVAEDRAVLVPTDGGAGRVFGDKDLVKSTGCDLGELFRPRADDRKEVRHILGLGQAAAVEIVAPAE